MQTLGERIKELRKSSGISQEHLAEILDVTRNTISNWENDCTSPTSQFLDKMCKYFNVEIDYFFISETCVTDTDEQKQGNTTIIEPIMKRLKIAIIIFGVLIALFAVFITAMFAISVSDFSMAGYSETVSSTSYNFPALLYFFIIFAMTCIICFLTLLIIYCFNCKKKQMQNNLCNKTE